MMLSIDKLVSELENSLESDKTKYWLISGGRSPKLIFEKFDINKDFSSVIIFFTDERLVPLKSKDSNFGNLKRYFLDRFNDSSLMPIVYPISRSNYRTYFNSLHSVLDGNPFDFSLLGTNSDDLHVASIFNYDQGVSTYSVIQRPGEDYTRYSFGFDVLNKSKYVVLILNHAKFTALKEKTGPVNHVRIDQYVLVDE